MTNTDYGAGLDRLLQLVTPDLHEHVDSNSLASITAWGTVFNAIHYARGLRALHEADLCAATTPVLRSLLEFTVGTMWLSDAGQEAVEVLNRGLAYSQDRLHRSLENADELVGWRERFPEEALDVFDRVRSTNLGPHPDAHLLSGFKHLLEAYGFAGWVPIYNVLSVLSHLSLTGAEGYVRTAKGGWNASQTLFEPELAPCVSIAFSLLLDAMAAFDAMLIGRPWRVVLEEIASEYGATITYAKREPNKP